jgi:hypothetical protein
MLLQTQKERNWRKNNNKMIYDYFADPERAELEKK